MVSNKTFWYAILFSSLVVACKNDNKSVRNTGELDAMVKTDTLFVEVPVEPAKRPIKEIKKELAAKGFKTFDYIVEKTADTILMQQYFIAFLKAGPIRSQNEEEAELLQEAHVAHLTKMYEMGYADISGPLGDNSEIRGITIYNVPTLKMADSLANADPMVKAGRLIIEIHPWWAAKGYGLR
ncbi:YciI family protein [Gaetbulibacter saemankumensis]|uniref:YciI family protein n=1 Tax=Gaetbulibacter saemankumensis TaxID=311208 RepID=UPI000417862E|nr:YciI family protein [Gaetbulibacter saemankumensis]